MPGSSPGMTTVVETEAASPSIAIAHVLLSPVKQPRRAWTQPRDLATHPCEFYPERSALPRSEGAGNTGRPLRPQPRV